MYRPFLLTAVLLASPLSAATYVADFTGPTLDGGLTFVPVPFDPGSNPQHAVGGGTLTLREPTGLPSEANVHTTFDVTGNFRASVTADLESLGTRGFMLGMYEYPGMSPFPLSTQMNPGASMFTSGLLNTQSYIFESPLGSGNTFASTGGSPTSVTYEIERIGNTVNTYLNGTLFNTGSYSSTNPSRFMISLCGSSCYSTTVAGEDNIARITDFRITYNAGVPEPATWATLIVGLGAVGASLRRRRRLALAA